MNASVSRSVFFISDRTGITAENLGHTLLTQFAGCDFELNSLPFINTQEKALNAADTIKQAANKSQLQPLVFSTLIDDAYRKIIAQTEAHIVDFFDAFIKPLEIELGTRSSNASGLSHGMNDERNYLSRMNAVNYTLNSDDGITTKDYKNADVILIGVSRSGKTPTCLYLAMQFGLHAANYPLTESDMLNDNLPAVLQPYRKKLFGLTINAERLCTIRSIRRQDSEYASFSQCQKETRMIQALLSNEKIAHIDSSHISIEEISTSVIQSMNIKRPSIF